MDLGIRGSVALVFGAGGRGRTSVAAPPELTAGWSRQSDLELDSTRRR